VDRKKLEKTLKAEFPKEVETHVESIKGGEMWEIGWSTTIGGKRYSYNYTATLKEIQQHIGLLPWIVSLFKAQITACKEKAQKAA
jgi:hypothetical protein